MRSHGYDLRLLCQHSLCSINAANLITMCDCGIQMFSVCSSRDMTHLLQVIPLVVFFRLCF